MIDFKTFAHLAHIDLGEPQPKPTSLEGDQLEAANTLWTSEDGKIEVGVWECSQGRFTARRDTNSEICHIVSGRGDAARSWWRSQRCRTRRIARPAAWLGGRMDHP